MHIAKLRYPIIIPLHESQKSLIKTDANLQVI